ncbi:hypothetical protein [Staphylococcus kloosii]|uniref:hypothetical protein n=1 Tax=Staphylococcus kloosii TaxID=29384 RepID=UPI001E605C6B|nr:hypothetical protein [Staphylococcus kloosii]MCD8878085.1 hypothetical protein [Staphylococcus kloosii]
MKTFSGLIILSSLVSSTVGVITNDFFNALALYTPLAIISVVINDNLKMSKLKKANKGAN